MDESIHLLTGAYAVDALEPAELAAFEAHLATCEDCTREVRELRATAARLGAAEAVHVPDRMREPVLAAVASTPQLRPARPDEERPAGEPAVPLRRPWTAQNLLAVAAAVLVAVVVALGVLLAHVSNDRDATTARAGAVASVLAAPDARTLHGGVSGGGRATVVVAPSQSAAVLLATGLPQPPSGHVYELWFLDAAGGATPAGTFVPSDAGTAAERLTGSPTGAAAVGMTVEPGNGSAKPTTTPILALPLGG